MVPAPPYTIAVYTIATLAPAFKTSRACFPFVIPPVAKMTFSLLVLREAGGELLAGVVDTAEEAETEDNIFSAASGAAPRAGSTAEKAAFVSAAVVLEDEETDAGI